MALPAKVSDERHYCGILLAAGRSMRFGSDKLLHPLADGMPMSVVSARAMTSAMPRVVAVVDRRNASLCELLGTAGIDIVTVSRDGEGMGTSLATGIAATADAEGWVVALADMPFISPATIGRVLAALTAGAPIAAPAYKGRRGHPVGFDRRFRDELTALRGDEGARGLLAVHADQLELIDCDDAGVLRDIDVPADLDELAVAEVGM